jgi:hypothetical protein
MCFQGKTYLLVWTTDENNILANESKRRDYFGSAEGASRSETLRQKDSCLTRLWRASTMDHQRRNEGACPFPSLLVEGQRDT